MQKKWSKRIILGLLIFFILFSFNFIFLTARTYAFPGEALSASIWKFFAETARNTIWKAIQKNWELIKTQAVANSLQMFARQFATKLATDLVTRGPGGKPLFSTKSVLEDLRDSANTAAGDFIGTLSQDWENAIGLNLCNPDLNVKLNIQATLLSTLEPPAPKCEWNDIVNNWEEFSAKMAQGQWQDYIAFSLSPQGSQIGEYLLTYNKMKERQTEAEQEATINRLKSDWLGVESLITKTIKTPADLVSEQASQLVPENPDKALQQASFSWAFTSNNLIGPFISQFTNSFISQLMNRWLREGLAKLTPSGQPGGGAGGAGTAGFGSSVYYSGGYTPAQAAASFSDLLTPTISTLQDYQLLEDFVTCNTGDISFNKLNNCVLSNNFYTAINQDPPLSIQEAINNGLIDGSLPFIGPADDQNKDQVYCWQSALCYSNLQKLRLARIVPLGWEIAATLSDGSVTLQQAISDFNAPASPFYHLVDPNWILKSPNAQCLASVNSPFLESSQSNNRTQYCVDSPSCIKEKDDGSCETGAFGYCTKEKNIWRLGGDQCDPWFDSCETLTKVSDNTSESYVKSSLETCPEAAAGCQWYAQSQEKSGENWSWQDDSRIYFNRNVDECEASETGCSQFIRTVSGSNLLYNGSFEIDEDNDDSPDMWSGVSQYENVGLNNSKAVLNDDGDTIDYAGSLEIIPYEFYTVSGWAKLINNGEQPVIEVKNLNNNDLGEVYSYYGEKIESTNNSLIVFADTSATASNNNGWYYLSLTFLANPNEEYPFGINIYLYAQPDQSSEPTPAWFDNIQLEKSQTPTNYYDYGAVNLTYLKKAPDYYECQGYTQKISAYNTETTCANAGFFWRSDIQYCVQSGDNNCASSALYCQSEEVGCQLYEPANGDPVVPGIAKAEDFCPAGCVGYQTYQQDPNYFDYLESTPTNPAEPESKNLIAETATSCSASELSCEEFTNLDEVAQGGEGKEYYSYIRQCVLPTNNNVTTYYTWEGSDTSGYQLKTWDLLQSNQNNSPCTNVNLGVPVEQIICQDTAINQQICDPADNNPNCREFFGLDGSSYFRLQDRTITASDDCHPFRRTTTNILYNAVPSEGTSCSAQSAGCRLYRGNTSGNVRTVFSDDFEDGATQGWEQGTISNASVYLNGHSIKSNNNHYIFTEPDLEFIANNLDLIVGKEYQVVMVAKKDGSGSDVISPKIGNGGTIILDFGSTILTDEWQQLTFGPVVLTEEINPNNAIFYVNSQSGLFYVDSVIIRELNNNLYLIKDSWNTPVSCDNPYNNPLGEVNGSTGNRTFIGAMLNCQEYTDSNNNTTYLHSFTNLCSEEAVGCEAMIDTYNSASPFEEEFNNTNVSLADDITVPADNYIYLVNDENKGCNSTAKGCQTLGQPSLDRSTTPDTVESYENVYLKNDPDQYGQTLCLDEELFCEEYRGENNSYYYFDPGNRLCEYQLNKNVGNQQITGWFRQGTTEACYGGTDYNLYSATDATNYDGWAGLCPNEQSGCTKFIDPYASTGANLIKNPGLEQDYDNDNIPDFYNEVGNGLPTANPVGYYPTGGVNGSVGVITIYDYPTDSFGQAVTFEKDVNYRLAISARRVGQSAPNLPDNQLDAKFIVNCPAGSNVSFNSSDNQFNDNNPNQAFIDIIVEPDTSFNEYGGQLTVASMATAAVTCNVYFGLIDDPGISNSNEQVLFDDFIFKEIEPYYYLNNSKLDKQTCSGQASLKQGCVLFNDTANASVSYDSFVSYQDSNSQNGALVDPETCSNNEPGCDSNTIIKVNRDRTCSEWYSCISSVFNFNPTSNSFEEQCSQLALCNEYSVSSGGSGQCANYISGVTPQKLTEDKYKDRDTSWGGEEYSGYSLFNKYPINSMVSWDMSSGEIPAFRLVSVIEATGQTNCEDTLGGYWKDNNCFIGIDGTGLHCSEFGNTTDCTDSTDVFGDQCGADNAFTCEIGLKSEARGYASADSPYPYDAWLSQQQYYSAANVCIEDQDSFDKYYNGSVSPTNPVLEATIGGEPTSCEGAYKKVEYANGIKTIYFGEEVIPPESLTDNSSGETEIVYQKTKSTNYLNWGGYCLDTDNSRLVNDGEPACTTWLMQDVISGISDINNQFIEAGYVPASDNEYYCVQAEGKMQVPVCCPTSASPTSTPIAINGCNDNSTKPTNCGAPDGGACQDNPNNSISAAQEACAVSNSNLYILEAGNWSNNPPADQTNLRQSSNPSAPYYFNDNKRDFYASFAAVKRCLGGSNNGYGCSNNNECPGGSCADGYCVVTDSNSPCYKYSISDTATGNNICITGVTTCPTYSCSGVPTAQTCETLTCGDDYINVAHYDTSPFLLGGACDDDDGNASIDNLVNEIEWKIPASSPEYHLKKEIIDHVVFWVVAGEDQNEVNSGMNRTANHTYPDLIITSENNCTPTQDPSIYPYDWCTHCTDTSWGNGFTSFSDVCPSAWDGQPLSNGYPLNDARIRLKFNSSNELISYKVRIRDMISGGSWNNEGVSYIARFYITEPCIKLAQVVDNNDNVAWTDNIWSGSDYTVADLSGGNPDLNYTYEQRNPPFGMCSEYLNELGPDDKQWFIGDSFSATNESPLYNAGAAYACEGDCQKRMCLGGGSKDGQECQVSDPDCKDVSVNPPVIGVCVGVGKVCSGGTNAGGPCNSSTDCGGGTCGSGGEAASNKNYTNGREQLKYLFARAYFAYQWPNNGNAYTNYPAGTWNVSNKTGLINPPTSPKIYAVGDNNIRVNSPVDIITINNNSGGSNISVDQQLLANVKFYFAADKNAMPIKTLKIDWGDGSSPTEINGYFQNHYSQDECTGADFGKIQGQTCMENYYSTSHLYSYALTGSSYACNGSGGRPNIPGAKCFKPLVQVIDNWGWCNKDNYSTNCDSLTSSNSAAFQNWIVINSGT